MTTPTSNTLASRIVAGVSVVVLALIFISLGIWQLDRAAALKANLKSATTIIKKITPLELIATPNTSLTAEALNRTVEISGHYVAEFKAPGQVDGAGKIADWEVALLQVGSHKGILVVRGLWSQRIENPGIQQSMLINIVGLLHARQDGDHAVNSAGVISRLDSAVIVGQSGLDLFDGYILASSESHNGAPLVRARVSAEKLVSRVPGFYWQHLSYVLIWWLMAGVVLYLPWYHRKVAL